ncbi:sensor histidine kinase [Phytoactinopolyspora mesophila]|nr:GAF domain-containing protein [Phytoactinopolyspora mesophila]
MLEALRRSLESAVRATNATFGVAGIVGPHRRPTTFVTVGHEPEPGPGGEPAATELLEEVINTGRIIRRQHPGVLGIPISADGEPLGAICLLDNHRGEFTEQDEHVLAGLAHLAQAVIEHLHRLEQTKQRQQWLAASNAVTTALLAGEDQSLTLRHIAQHARRAADAAAAAIARPDPSDIGIIRFQVVDAEEDMRALNGLAIPASGTATGEAFLTKAPVAVRGYGSHIMTQNADRQTVVPAVLKDLDSAIAAPLIVGHVCLGALTVARFDGAPPFTDEDVQLVESFAHHAALVMEFGRITEESYRLAVLEDRHRIARDLHDVVIQRLYASGLRLYALSADITDTAVADRANQLVDEIDLTIDSIRASIFALEDDGSESTSLRSQIRHLASGFTDVLGFEPWVNFEGPLDAAVPDQVRPELHGVVREALSNVARHASASSVYVGLTVDGYGRELTLTVVDNGVGVQSRRLGGRGLPNLEARAARWGGEFTTNSEAGHGTSLTWRIPLAMATAGELQGATS